jgi:hypothetical protein
MKKRNDPPGYPGDDRITQWYNELKEMVREERGLSCVWDMSSFSSAVPPARRLRSRRVIGVACTAPTPPNPL